MFVLIDSSLIMKALQFLNCFCWYVLKQIAKMLALTSVFLKIHGKIGISLTAIDH